MVAEHDNGTVRGILLDQFEHRHWIGAITDEVAEKRISIRSQRIRMREARGDGLEIAMNIGEQGELQTGPAF
jgi:hypothetical protein